MLLLIAFPVILLGMTWVFLAIINYFTTGYYDQAGYFVNQLDADSVNWTFTKAAPFIIGGVAIWFAIAYFSNTKMIQKATGAQPLMRRENPRVYNIVENLCMACGMDMPKVNVIDDPQLNAFASGIDKNSYTVTVTTGLLDRLNDEELAGVIGHELTHIRNRDTRLLITSIIFVGIVSTVLSLVVRMIYNRMLFGGFSSSSDSSQQQRQRSVGRSHHGYRSSLCRHRLPVYHADTLCHFAQTRVYGRCRRCRTLWQSVGPRFGSQENFQQPRTWRSGTG